MFFKSKPKAGEVWNTVGGVRVSILRFVINDCRTNNLLECSDKLTRTTDGVVWAPTQSNNENDLISKVNDCQKGSGFISKIPYFGLVMGSAVTFAMLFTLNALGVKFF